MTVVVRRQAPEPPPKNEKPGQKMRRLRLELGLSMREVAEIAGTSTNTIFAWESGRRFGMSAEALVLPRRIIGILSGRIRRRARKNE